MAAQDPLQLYLSAAERESGSAGRDAAIERLHRDLRFVAETVTTILDNLPVQRRPVPDSVKALHLRVIWERRNGFCPACETVRICDARGKLPTAEFDHWYGRHRNRAEETWAVCSECNAALERPEFKQATRSAFEAYQAALRRFSEGCQRTLQ